MAPLSSYWSTRTEPVHKNATKMPTIKEILQEERNRESGWLVQFLEGKFWKAYEQSAYVLTKLYNFKPSKRFIKLVGEEVISVGFPQELLGKYLPGAVVSPEGKTCRARVQIPHDEPAFREWKSSAHQGTQTETAGTNRDTGRVDSEIPGDEGGEPAGVQDGVRPAVAALP